MEADMQRREFITLLGGAAAGWPFAARAQKPAMPVIAFINGGSPITSARYAAAFRTGLSEAGYDEGKNVTVEYDWLEGQYDRVPALMTDLVRRQVAVIVTPGSNVAALAAKAATTTIPIIFGVGGDPVHLGLVASLTRPGGNATGVNIFNEQVMGKRLRLLHDLLPKAVRVGVLVNPANPSTTETTLREVQKAAPTIGLQIQILNATTSDDIEAAFEHGHLDALFVAADGFFNSRRVQFAILAARNSVPVVFPDSSYIEVGGLMSYGTNVADMYRRVGVYAGRVLNGTKPADLPVTEYTKFEFVINAQTARALHIAVPPAVLAIADEVVR
jgi:putative tryptophan/tyrosine transport system substrate-binding protein